ncbi:unnamed protein product [Rotaria sp. Silwood2]|nr:unnamed protein product [Rotaria sp. Silwood2]CAF2770073.1 unnamed protein product [Rotaria sp. Silwood2]CAF2902490.1 unnamed protein product [Rotaria sp. Silwood2]CAF3184054.1 unnamed protein product [Rotaria sp. Silwood2]CAF4187472.1 unnamed protein product [Rotaria sp. Silwood2]
MLLCHSQVNIPLTEPKLIAVTAVNSTALTVTWEFANSTYDQSDTIKIVIEFYEFYFNYGPINTSINYTFTSTNKTITSLTKNFDLVNAFYYVCLSSNSTNINVTVSLVKKTCQLKRTCSRFNSSICSEVPFVVISHMVSSSNSFIINVNWLKNVPYLRNGTTVQLINNGVTGTSLSLTENNTYINQPYQFSGLQSNTNYTVNIIVNYTIFGRSLSDVIYYNVQTSRSSNLFYTSDSFILMVCSVFLFFSFLE